MQLRILLRSTRFPFLILTPVSVFLGASTAVANGINIDLTVLMLALVGALCAHISVNSLNEYFDFTGGLDLITVKTPFSGGSGALPENPGMVNAVLFLSLATLMITLATGGYLIWYSGSGIVPLGFVGVMLILFYTSKVNKYPFICLIAPGLGFGVVMVVGTQYVLVGHYLPLAWLVALVPFLLVNNLLLLNQYPDIQADTSVGRNHLPIAYGIKWSNLIYGLSALAAAVAILSYVLAGYLPLLSLIAILPLSLALYSLSGAVKYGADIGSHPQYLAANVAVTLLCPLLLGVSLIYG